MFLINRYPLFKSIFSICTAKPRSFFNSEHSQKIWIFFLSYCIGIYIYVGVGYAKFAPTQNLNLGTNNLRMLHSFLLNSKWWHNPHQGDHRKVPTIITVPLKSRWQEKHYRYRYLLLYWKGFICCRPRPSLALRPLMRVWRTTAFILQTLQTGQKVLDTMHQMAQSSWAKKR